MTRLAYLLTAFLAILALAAGVAGIFSLNPMLLLVALVTAPAALAALQWANRLADPAAWKRELDYYADERLRDH